jgi:mRNA interferase RelE/StbE
VTGYLVTFTASAKKELKDLPSEAIDRILPKIRGLSVGPRPAGCKKLHGYKDHWRIRVGNYRVVYAIDDTGKSVDIRRIAHRKDVYEA